MWHWSRCSRNYDMLLQCHITKATSVLKISGLAKIYLNMSLLSSQINLPLLLMFCWMLNFLFVVIYIHFFTHRCHSLLHKDVGHLETPVTHTQTDISLLANWTSFNARLQPSQPLFSFNVTLKSVAFVGS